jgi:ribosome recycling factor/biopolymer transport protein ExbB/TolQ
MTLLINSAVAIIILLILGRSILLSTSDKQTLDALTLKLKNIENQEEAKKVIRNDKIFGTAGLDYLSSQINYELGSITNLNSSECFFLENISVNKGLGRLKLNANAFVSIGVLGTFIGLALGLSSIDTTVGADSLAQQIDELLKNVSTAFLTSIFGLVGSLLALFTERILRSSFEQRLSKICDHLDTLFLNIRQYQIITHAEGTNLGIQAALTAEINGHSISPSDLAVQFLEFNKRQTDSLESFSSELAFTIEDLMNKVFNDEESTFRKEFANIASKLTALSESLRSPAEDMTKSVVEELQKSLRSMIEEFQTSISDGARQEMDELTNQLSQVSSSLSSIPTVLGELQNSTESSILKINEQMEDSARIIGEETTESVNQLSTIIGTLVREIEEIQERQLSLTEGQSESFEKMSLMSEKFTSTLQDLDSLSEEIAEAGGQVGATADILKNTSSSLEKSAESVDNSNHALNSTLSSFMSETSQLIGEQSNLTSNIIEVMDTIQSHSTTIKEQYEELDSSISDSFKSIQSGIDTFLRQIKDSNDGYLNDYAEAVNGISNSLALGADEIRQAMEEISESFDKAVEKLESNEEK